MKKLFALLLALALCLSAAAFASAEDINVAYMPNYASLWSVVTGIQQGYFAEEGLNVTLYEFADGPTIIAAMENGSISIGYIGPGAHKLCIAGRAKIFCMSQIGNSDAVLASKKAGIETASQLKGKKVGYASGTSSEMILRYCLEDVGLAWEDIQAFEMDASSLANAMISGTIDACACWSPSTGIIINACGGDVFPLCSNVDFADRDVSLASWIVLPKYYEENKDLVKRYTRALYKAIDFASNPDNYEQVAGWVAAQCAQDLQVAMNQTGDAAWPNSAEIKALLEDGTMESYYKVQQQGFIKTGAVEKEVPVTDYVLFDNMKDAFN